MFAAGSDLLVEDTNVINKISNGVVDNTKLFNFHVRAKRIMKIVVFHLLVTWKFMT